MTGLSVRSPLRVTDPRAARLVTHDRTRAVLAHFLDAEGTVGGAARALDLDLRVVHRDVRALLAAGLLALTRRQPRAGRAVQHYRASDGAYFVPLTGADAPELRRGPAQAEVTTLLSRAFEREFDRALRADGIRREWGLRLYRDPQGQPAFDECYLDAELRTPLSGWQGPQALVLAGSPVARLTDRQAAEVQTELIRLMARLQALDSANEAAGHGRPFLLQLGLAPISEAERAELRAW